MKIGFAKQNISPSVGVELGGYAGYRPCSGIHDPLWCKAIVLEQEGLRYALVVLDLMCADESLRERIAQAVADLGISRERLVVAAIHSHAAPAGVIPGAGALAKRTGSSSTRSAPQESAILARVHLSNRANVPRWVTLPLMAQTT